MLLGMLLLFASSCILAYHLGFVRKKNGETVVWHPTDFNGWAVVAATGFVLFALPIPAETFSDLFWGAASVGVGVGVGAWWRDRNTRKQGCIKDLSVKQQEKVKDPTRELGPADELGLTDQEIAEKRKRQSGMTPEELDEE